MPALTVFEAFEKLGKRFIEQLEVRKNLEILTLYLAEKDPKLISLGRLKLALSRQDDKPL